MTSKEHIDPAVIRPGRVDVHIHFPLCDFTAFKTLANNYLGLKEHKLFPQVEGIFRDGASLSPAEIGELMIANRNSPSRALKSVINALQTEGERRGTPASGRRLLHERTISEDFEEEMSGPLCGGGSSPAVKEFKKLYGLLGLKGNRKSQSFNLTRELRNDDQCGGGSPRRSLSPAYHRRQIPGHSCPRSPEHDRRWSSAAYEPRGRPKAYDITEVQQLMNDAGVQQLMKDA
ncbi:unnamed protein product [Eruca vesicaria subsp. sativa]|uniref:AAA+ ATPase At3g28540-like C-terminal domain-containing protein n=1 Tax=Eruca vesicaria subsp. sativa TaxID=29727 RepID=A0ABC8JFH4_ERUVS|nr:unnamed protein product [Eruca vesicaria subsp. sativa]